MSDEEIPPTFAVYLSYNPADRLAVRAIAEHLQAQHVRPWFNEWELRPGFPEGRARESQIQQARAAAVFVGKSGLGPWEMLEQEALIHQFVRRNCPVIPVLLPDASAEPQLPLFLSGMTWVDFRIQDPDPLAQLIWGITGIRTTSPGEGAEITEQLTERYLTALTRDQTITHFQVLNMHTPLDVQDLYIRVQLHTDPLSPRLTHHTQTADPLLLLQQRDVSLNRHARTAQDPAEALRSYQRCIILGDPGAGKTTLLKYLALQCANGHLPGLPAIPIYLRLNAFATSHETTLLTFAAARWEKDYGIPASTALACIEQHMQQGNTLFLLDALDETLIGEQAEQAEATYRRVSDEVSRLADHSWVVVTARKAGYERRKLHAFTELTLLDFRWDEITHFIERWFEHHSQEQKRDYAPRLCNALQSQPRIRALAANPLLLTLITLSYEQHQELPQRRSELYQKCAEILLERWDHDYRRNVQRFRSLTTRVQRRILEQIAWHFHAQGLQYFPEDQLLSLIETFLPGVQMQPSQAMHVLNEISGDSGLLRKQDENLYCFLHLTFQEHFTAQQAISTPAVPSLLPHLADPWWEEVLILYAGEVHDASPLLQHLLSLPAPEAPDTMGDDLFSSKLILAGRCIAAHPTLRESALWDETFNRLFRLLLHTEYALTRRLVAETLVEIASAYLDHETLYERLISLLSSEHAQRHTFVQVSLASALGTYGVSELAARLLEVLVRSTGDFQQEVREALEIAIARLADHTLLPRLVELISDPNTEPPLAFSVAYLLSAAGNAQIAGRLLPLLSAPYLDRYVRTALAFSVALLADEASISALVSLYADPTIDRYLGANILLALSQREDQSIAAALFSLLARQDIAVEHRQMVAHALSIMAAPTLVDPLTSLLFDPIQEEVLRNACAQALTTSALKTQPQKILHLLSSPELSPSVRIQIALTLASSAGADHYLTVLPDIRLHESDQQVKAALRLTLAILGYRPELSWLREQFLASQLPDQLYPPAAATLVHLLPASELLTALFQTPTGLNQAARRTLPLRHTALIEALGATDRVTLVPDLISLLANPTLVERLRLSLATTIGILGYKKETAERLLALWRSQRLRDSLHMSPLGDALYLALWRVCRKARVTILPSGPGRHEYHLIEV